MVPYTEASRDRIFRFGPYEVSEQSAEIRKHGVRLRLQEQPFRVLIALLDRPGELVTREELQSLIWSADTFVDFDRGLNTAISKLRTTLSDEATNSRYIETQARRGYRFIAPVTVVSQERRPLSPSPERQDQLKRRIAAEHAGFEKLPARSSIKRWFVGALIVFAAVALAVGVAIWVTSGTNAGESAYSVSALTTYPGLEFSPAISPDGTRVAFAWTGPDRQATYSIYEKQIGHEAARRLTQPGDDEADGAPQWTPDGRRILFARRSPSEPGIYTVSADGGTAERITAAAFSGPHVRRRAFGISPDGSQLVYATRTPDSDKPSLMLLDLKTLKSRPLTNPDPQSSGDSQPTFSPDGKWVAFLRDVRSLPQVFLILAAGGEPSQLTNDAHTAIEGLAWSRDGQYLLMGGYELRIVPVFAKDHSPMLMPGIPPAVITPTVRGTRMAYAQASWSSNIWRLDLTQRGTLSPTQLIASTREQAAPSYSPDGAEIAFQSNRSGHWEIWKCKRDGSNPVQLTFLQSPMAGTPRWSPDGKWIAFDSLNQGNSGIYLVSADAGVVRTLTPESTREILPAWSRDSKWVYFSSDRDGVLNIWKTSPAGTSPEQVTKAGGVYAAESLDGLFVYYSKSESDATLWRVPVKGGAEEPVPAAPRPGNPSHWAISRSGIYIIDENSDLLLFKPAEKKTTRLTHNPNFRTDWSMAVSPDGGELLWAQMDSMQSDLMLVDNFNPRAQAVALTASAPPGTGK